MVMHLSYKQELFKGMRYYYYYMAGKKYGKISYITVFNIFPNPPIFKLWTKINGFCSMIHAPSLQLDLVNGNNTTLHTYIETT